MRVKKSKAKLAILFIPNPYVARRISYVSYDRCNARRQLWRGRIRWRRSSSPPVSSWERPSRPRRCRLLICTSDGSSTSAGSQWLTKRQKTRVFMMYSDRGSLKRGDGGFSCFGIASYFDQCRWRHLRPVSIYLESRDSASLWINRMPRPYRCC